MESFKEEKKEFKENYSDAELRAMSETELEVNKKGNAFKHCP